MFGKKSDPEEQDIERRIDKKGSLEALYIQNVMNPSHHIQTKEEEKGLYSLRPVQQILNLLLGESNELKPVFDIYYKCRYPEVESITGLKPSEIPGLLERLAAYKILDSHFHERIITCHKCNSANLAPRYHCPSCDSPSLIKHKTINHTSCGYTAVEDEFVRSGNSIQCPRCNDMLNPSSPDVVINDEGWFICNDCSKRSRDPAPIFHCRECKRVMYVGDVTFKNLYSYALSNAVDISSIVLIQPFSDLLVALGFHVESPGIIIGKSGIEHRFDIICRKDSMTPIVIDVVYSAVLVNNSHAIKLFGAAFDAGLYHKIMIAVPEVEDSTSKLAVEYGITLIVGSQADDILEKLKKAVLSLKKNSIS